MIFVSSSHVVANAKARKSTAYAVLRAKLFARKMICCIKQIYDAGIFLGVNNSFIGKLSNTVTYDFSLVYGRRHPFECMIKGLSLSIFPFHEDAMTFVLGGPWYCAAKDGFRNILYTARPFNPAQTGIVSENIINCTTHLLYCKVVGRAKPTMYGMEDIERFIDNEWVKIIGNRQISGISA